MILQKNSLFSKTLQLIRPFIYREIRIQPVISHNLTKPTVDLTKHDPDNKFSPSVLNFIKARDFENSGGRKVDVVSLNGENKGTIEVNNFVFGTNPRIDILHRSMVWYRASIRRGTASTKTRGEVRGGGRKPWKQKGSGRARQGSIRSPLWRGGGKAKGPKPKDWSYHLPFKVRRMGLRVALSCRLAQGDLTVVDDFSSLPTCSQEFQKLLIEQGLENSLLVDAFENKELNMLTMDLEKVSYNHALFLHVYGILVHHKLVLSLDALRILEEKLCEDNRIINTPEYELYHQDMLLDKKYINHEFDPKTNCIFGPKISKPAQSIRQKPAMSSIRFM